MKMPYKPKTMNMKALPSLVLLLLAFCTAQAQRGDTCRSADIPAPTVADLDPANRHSACRYSSLALAGTPSQPQYNLVWEPQCASASPQSWTGDSVTVGFLNEVADVWVYNYDMVLQCRSADHLVHTVQEFEIADVDLPTAITACPGTVITWGDDNVPDQSAEGVLYRWTIEELLQRCASLQGSQFSNTATLTVHEGLPLPTTFTVQLDRKFCGNFHDYTVIPITVKDSPMPLPQMARPGWTRGPRPDRGNNRAECAAIDSTMKARGIPGLTITTDNSADPNATCDNTPIRLTAHLGYDGSIVSSTWYFGDGSHFTTASDNICHTFEEGGPYYINVTAVDNYGCTRSLSAPYMIVSSKDIYTMGLSLSALLGLQCPNGTPTDIEFSPHAHDHQYNWWRLKDQTLRPTGNIHILPTYRSDTYLVHVIDANYCQAQAATNVSFLNAPTARIYARNDNLCAGESITLYGSAGGGNSYSWNVSGPGGYTAASTDPDYTFTAPAYASGTFTVTLTVTNNDNGCSDTDTKTLTVTATKENKTKH